MASGRNGRNGMRTLSVGGELMWAKESVGSKHSSSGADEISRRHSRRDGRREGACQLLDVGLGSKRMPAGVNRNEGENTSIHISRIIL
jgi:hypothetical protein